MTGYIFDPNHHEMIAKLVHSVWARASVVEQTGVQIQDLQLINKVALGKLRPWV